MALSQEVEDIINTAVSIFARYENDDDRRGVVLLARELILPDVEEGSDSADTAEAILIHYFGLLAAR